MCLTFFTQSTLVLSGNFTFCKKGFKGFKDFNDFNALKEKIVQSNHPLHRPNKRMNPLHFRLHIQSMDFLQ